MKEPIVHKCIDDRFDICIKEMGVTGNFFMFLQIPRDFREFVIQFCPLCGTSAGVIASEYLIDQRINKGIL